MESDTTERPSWLNAEFLEEVLQSREGMEDINVLSSKVELAVGKGENYTSILYRVGVTFNRRNCGHETEGTSLIIKCLSSVEVMAKFLRESNVFEKETGVYQVTVPAMFRICEEMVPKSEIKQLTPLCYKTSRPHTLILEDLTTLGFKMANRHTRLDLDHCTVALKGLAQFHAMSVALYSRDSKSMDIYEESVYDPKNRDIMLHFMKSTMDALSNVVTKWSGFEKYPEKLRETVPKLWDILSELVKPTPNSLSVLNHGDCWVNNMMFHYSADSGKVDGVRFVDFQLSRFSSPALDLQYFIYTSPNEDVRSQHTELLLEIYHQELCNNFKVLGLDSNQYTIEELKTEFERKSFFGFITACTVLTAVLADPSEAFDMDNIKEDGSTIDAKSVEKSFSGYRFKEAFQKLLPHFESKGIFE